MQFLDANRPAPIRTDCHRGERFARDRERSGRVRSQRTNPHTTDSTRRHNGSSRLHKVNGSHALIEPGILPDPFRVFRVLELPDVNCRPTAGCDDDITRREMAITSNRRLRESASSTRIGFTQRPFPEGNIGRARLSPCRFPPRGAGCTAARWEPRPPENQLPVPLTGSCVRRRGRCRRGPHGSTPRRPPSPGCRGRRTAWRTSA